MPRHPASLALADMIAAIERVRDVIDDMALDAFEADWRAQWLVERGIEIVSEASRRLPSDMKAKHPAIPWPKIAGIGNVLRHEYGSVSAPLMWKLAREDLLSLEQACRDELEALQGGGSQL